MGTFELDAGAQGSEELSEATLAATEGRRRIKDECIIALKVYDQCRSQDCLTPSQIGPARAAVDFETDHIISMEGEVICPPREAATVSVEDLCLDSIIIISCEPSAFKPGYWDVELKYTFAYTLVFRNASAQELVCVPAKSIYNKSLTLFGSVGTDIVIGTNLFGSQRGVMTGDPSVVAEGKAISLGATLRYVHDCHDAHGIERAAAVDVGVTIGLFTIIKMVRLVNLVVESTGFCIPPVCNSPSPTNPCEFFESLAFPKDIFSPPQKEDFCEGAPGIRDCI